MPNVESVEQSPSRQGSQTPRSAYNPTVEDDTSGWQENCYHGELYIAPKANGHKRMTVKHSAVPRKCTRCEAMFNSGNKLHQHLKVDKCFKKRIDAHHASPQAQAPSIPPATHKVYPARVINSTAVDENNSKPAPVRQ